MKATSRLAPSASSPRSVEEPSARTSPFCTLSPSFTTGFWWMSVPWLERMNLVRLYSSRLPRPSTTMRSASTSITEPRVAGHHDVAGVDRGAVLEPGADERRLGDHQRHRLPLHVRPHQGAVGVVVLQERDQRRRRRRRSAPARRPCTGPVRAVRRPPRPPASGRAPARAGTARSSGRPAPRPGRSCTGPPRRRPGRRSRR